jgi:hypothetical protein
MFFLLVFALLAPSDRTVASDRYQIKIDAPVGWIVQKQSAYPSVVAAMAHRDGGRLTLSAQKARSLETAQTLCDRNKAALEKTGMRIQKVTPLPPDAVEVEATAKDGSLGLRQIYFVRGQWGFSLTLSAPSSKMQQYMRDLDAAWHSVRQ